MRGIAPPLRTETKIVGSGAIFPPPLRFPALRVHHPGLGNRCRPLTEVGESRGDRETGQVLGCRQAGLASNQYIRGNFPARSGPGTLTVARAESAVSHIIPGDGRNPDALGRAGPRGWDPGRAAGGMGHAGPATRTSRTTGVTERRPLVSRPGPPPSARASGQAACRTDAQRLVSSLPSVSKLRRGLSPRLRRLEGSVFS